MKEIKGLFTEIDGERFYKIENYDQMDDFFMTITSSSDIWNFCWAHGGLTAGRIDCDHAVFPYYTADKIADFKSITGPYTAIKVTKGGESCFWEPFASLYASEGTRLALEKNTLRKIYKNVTGTKVWFEEINTELNLKFMQGWTSSEKYGLVRMVKVENLGDEAAALEILDGCRNIMPACCTADFQNVKSVLLDAYKKTDVDKEANLALFAVSSIVSDKAEPNEGLYANVAWFSTEDEIILNNEAPVLFARNSEITSDGIIKGKRPAVYIRHNISLNAKTCDSWFQIFDTWYDAKKLVAQKKAVADRVAFTKDLVSDIEAGVAKMTDFIAQADGIQHTGDEMAASHHSANVMFNIMRGGIFQNQGKIDMEDFKKFVGVRNKALLDKIQDTSNPQVERLLCEYMPLTFSRRHGDPSRPWNRFSIKLQDNNGNPILNYEGNWRDIFQNWEALAWSYPAYIKNMSAKFLNAMTIDGFNPYHISRDGLNWEIPDPDDPWAQIGYWGDHQVIYLEKLLEFWDKTNHAELMSMLNKSIFSSSNVPYRIKSYADLTKDPRNSIAFDRELSERLMKETAEMGSDAKLVRDENGQVALVTLTTKLMQIIIAKMANFIPGGGIWLNTQRPEWNDANNALAGWGLSMVTLYYIRRFISFLLKLYEESELETLDFPEVIKMALVDLGNLFESSDAEKVARNSEMRAQFNKAAELIFEKERNALYKNGYSGSDQLTREKVIGILKAFMYHVDCTVKMNKRDDGLYHAYNTMRLDGNTMEVEYLQEMLEGQVAVLSSGLLSGEEALELYEALKKSAMYEPRQNSYMLYPNKELPHFENKNCVKAGDTAGLENLIERTGGKFLRQDADGTYHFNPDFRNEEAIDNFVAGLKGTVQAPDETEYKTLMALYEKTFNHQKFTGRSGTFYAYEGLGSIYWHMNAKLLLAIQENVFACKDTEICKKLTEAYYDVQKGLGYNKTPEIWGAFPMDPYSHTPWKQGAKQPGMTGQVKEEVLTRWGELGICIEKGIASFKPTILRENEFIDGKLDFTWCGVKVEYVKGSGSAKNCMVITQNGATVERDGTSLTLDESARLFARNGSIEKITVVL